MEEIARVVAQIRSRWPRVRILLRADSGFARETLMAWCEQNRIDFVFGLARNARLVDEIAVELIQAEDEARQTGKPARRFTGCSFRQARLRGGRLGSQPRACARPGRASCHQTPGKVSR